MTGRKAEVAALEQKIVAEATMPWAKVGWPMARKPRSKGPVWGAAAGRSRVVTPILWPGFVSGCNCLLGRAVLTR